MPSRDGATVRSNSTLKGYGTQREPNCLTSPHPGDRQPLGEQCPGSTPQQAGQSLKCRIPATALLDICCAGCKGQGSLFMLLFCFPPSKARFKQQTKKSYSSLCNPCVCEIYQYSVGFLSALILLDFVIVLKRGGEGLDITAK